MYRFLIRLHRSWDWELDEVSLFSGGVSKTDKGSSDKEPNQTRMPVQRK